MVQLFSLGIISALMKKTLPILALSFLFAACSHRSDAEMRKNLPGTWHCVQAASSNQGSQNMFIITSDGNFTNDVIRADGSLATEIGGTFQVQDRYLVATVTMDSRNSRSLPYVQRAKIIRADDREIIIGSDCTTQTTALKKDSR